jgi:hypothetical protein
MTLETPVLVPRRSDQRLLLKDHLAHREISRGYHDSTLDVIVAHRPALRWRSTSRTS